MRRRSWLVIGAALAATGGAVAAPADAATYTEDACGRAGGGGAAAAGFLAVGAVGATADECARGGGLALALDAGAGPGAWAGWRFVPPPGTTVAALVLRRRVAVPARSAAVYALRGSAERCDASTRCGDGVFDLPVPADALDFRLGCPAAGCGEAGAAVVLRRLRIVLRDDSAPVLEGGTPLAGRILRGRSAIPVRAHDAGGGVSRVALLVDGAQRAARTLCRPPFTRAVPCPPRARAALPLDTTGLRDGPHRLQVAATDATGANRTVSAPVGILVDNAAAPRVTLRAPRPRLRNGEVLVLVARVPPAARGRDVAFEVRVGRRWRAFALRHPGAGGLVRVRHRLRRTYRRLRYAFRAVVRGGAAAGRSRVVRVLVN